MGVLGIVLLVIFCIVSVLLTFLVAIQDEKSSGLGGIFSGTATKAFGGNAGAFITRATTILAVTFMVLALIVALVNKSSDQDILAAIETQRSAEAQTTTWLDTEASQDSTSADSVASN